MTGQVARDTVTVRLAYGEDGLEVELPAGRTTVVEPTYVAAAEDQAALLRDALRHPWRGRRCASSCDRTDRRDLDV